jgi:translation initiation factor IF-3
MAGQNISNRKINTQTLCDLIGSRYYPHNEEIEMEQDKIVKCFDENDAVLGEMTLREALQASEGAKKDLVLRNAKTTPPVVKIMNYKKELLKRLFKKLGKEQEDKDLKMKTMRLTTNISFHDLENRKR